MSRPKILADTEKSRGHRGLVRQVAFDPGGGRIASGSDDRTVRVWDSADGAELAAFDPGLGRIWAVAFAPDGLTGYAAGEADRIAVWDLPG